VELLLFEWRPRSFVPVAIAAATAGVMRRFFLSNDPLFPMQQLNQPVQPIALLAALALGVAGGVLAILLSRAVYASEDLFENQLPIHWMWWPAVGGIVIGIGGFIFPRALGTGYDVIYSLINGNGTWQLIAGVLIVKSIVWSFSLGSGTSGGILAPLLMIGGALGALFAPVLPTLQAGAWPLAGMAAVLSGAIGCPLTGAVLTLELTHNYGLLLPVLASSVAAHAFTVLFQKRSILTERISRRGHHLSREYGVDPLEVILVSEVMRTCIVVLPVDTTAADARLWIESKRNSSERRGQRLYPVVDSDGRLSSVITRRELAVFANAGGDPHTRIPSVAPVFAHPEETLRIIAERMATSGLFAIPVVEQKTRKLLGVVTVEELLKGREWAHFRENKHERLRMPFRRRQTPDEVAETV
jgi:CBS domain-containing protein